MRTPRNFALLISFCITVGAATARADDAKVAAKADDGSIPAKVVAINRGFGFLVVDVGSKDGVKASMKVSVVRGEKRSPGILKIGEIEDKQTVLEFIPGKSDPNDKFTEVIFLLPGKGDEQ